jgi:predicted O-methyltransferase YrrM
MDDPTQERIVGTVTRAMGAWDQGATCLAALALAVDRGTTGPLSSAARDLMTAAGLGELMGSVDDLPISPEELRGMAAAPLLQGAAVVGGPDYQGWGAAQSDEALVAQGRASGAAAMMFASVVLPHCGDLGDRLARPGARMLDVGTGIGGLAVGFAETFPELHVTGIDVMPRVLEVGRGHVAGSPAAARVELRHLDVVELTDRDCYDLAWIPAPFVPEPAFSTGVRRIVAALRPGGMLMIGHGRLEGAGLEVAVTRFKTVMYGGTPLDAASAVDLLTEQGLTSVQTVPTPPGAPMITVGRRAAS